MTAPDLNPVQRAAVEHESGPALVLAGAGSGKTRVLIARLVHLMRDRQIAPYSILAVTFTNKAAGEMRRRVEQMLGHEPKGLWIGTFHAICARLLRREAEYLGFSRQFTIFDETDQVSLVKRLLEGAGRSTKEFPPRLIRSLISQAKNRMLTPERYAAEADQPIERVVADVYEQMTRRLREQNAMDFDDLLLHPLTLFREHPERMAYYRDRFRAVLVDEFQDTNRAQYLFVRGLADTNDDLCAVGDDDQSIYGWRGADVRNMLDFQQDYPTTSVFRLEENYRSTQMILDAANGIIEVNTDRLGKTLFTSRRGGEPVTLVSTADERDEAEWVARELRERTSTDMFAYEDIAVLYRTNSQSRAFEEAFRRAAIPYRVVGSVSFYARREIKDLLAYLRLLANPADDEAFVRAVRIPKRGLGPAALNALHEAAASWKKPLLETAGIADRIGNLPPRGKKVLVEFASLIDNLASLHGHSAPATILEEIIERIGYDHILKEEGHEGVDRWENVEELISGAVDWTESVDGPFDEDEDSTPLERFLSSTALTTSDENVAGDTEGVSLMTVHTAKGLEWPIVLVAGLEDGLMPLSRSTEVVGGEEEERRLLYVAATRARDRLYLTWAKSRRRNGRLMPNMPSRFFQNVPRDVVDERTSSGVFGADLFRKHGGKRPSAFVTPSYSVGMSKGPVEEPEFESQLRPRYIKGERVRHPTFGSGAILALAGQGRDVKVTVAFDDGDVGTKDLLVRFAGLERDWEPA